jgi:hypothetical protein
VVKAGTTAVAEAKAATALEILGAVFLKLLLLTTVGRGGRIAAVAATVQLAPSMVEGHQWLRTSSCAYGWSIVSRKYLV